MSGAAPNSNDRDARLEQAIADYLQRIESGQALDREEFASQHPEVADELRSFFANRAALERLAEPLRGSQYEPTVGLAAERAAADVTRVRYFGDYELLEELGRGGMGVVYKAKQTTLNRLVALKMILSGQLASTDDVQRFKQEAEAAANLDHPNIAPIYETGEHAGQHYFSMKLIEGRSLRDVLPELRDDMRAGVALLSHIARAVHHAHQRGVLHRDLKPANVLLDQERSPYVTDFGLAKRVEGGSDMTRTGAIVGTPSYMAPEQAMGERHLSTAVDIYSLGAILYELLTGQPPFRAGSPLETLLQVASCDVRRPSAVVPKADRDLETVALKCLERDATKRYDSAAALADELERWLRGEAILARPAGRAERTWRWCRRNPVVAALLGAVAASLLLGTIVATLFAVRASQNARQARINEQSAIGNATRASEQEQLARTEQRAAEQARTRAEWLAYAGQIALAQREWQDGDVGHARELLDTCQWNLRGWEHDYLHTVFNDQQRTYRGHTSAVLCVAFSPDGRRIACGGGNPFSQAPGDYRLRIWEVESGREVLTLAGHNADVGSLSFSPDGSRLASGGYDVKIWDAHTGDEQRTLADASGPALFSPDGTRLLTCGSNGAMKIWDVETGEAIATMEGGTTRTSGRGLAWHPAGKRIVGSQADRALKVWDAKTGEPVLDLAESAQHHPTVAFSPDGQRIAGIGYDHAITLWDAETGKRIRRLQGHRDYVSSVAFSPDSRRLCSGSYDKLLTVWDVATGRAIRSFKGHAAGLTSVAFNRDGNRIVSGSHDDAVKVWDAEVDQGPLTVQSAGTSGVRNVSVSPDGDCIAVSTWYEQVRIIDSGTGKELRKLSGSSHPVALSSDGQRLVADGGKNSLRVWDANTGDILLTLKSQPDTIHCVAFSPDGSRIVSGSRDHSLIIWDARTGDELHRLTGHANAVNCVAFRPDGTEFVSGSFDDTLKIWAVRTGQERLTLNGHIRGAGGVNSVAYSSDGRRIVSGGTDRSIRVWDSETGRELRSLTGHTNSVDAIAISPDGRRIVSGSFDKTIRVWDAESGQVTLILKGHREAIKALAFTPDGRRLVSGAESVKVWDARASQVSRGIQAHSHVVTGIVFSPDGSRLASGGWNDRLTKVWDVHTGQERLSLVGGHHPVAFSPDGQRLLSDSGHDSLKLWDTRDGRELLGVDDCSSPAVFSSDGQRVTSGGADKSLKLWDARNGQLIQTLPVPAGIAFFLAISPDGQRAVSSDGTLQKLLDVPTRRELQSFDAHNSVAFRSDSRQLVTGHTSLVVWNAETGKELRTLGTKVGTIHCLALSPDARRIAVASDRSISVVDASTGDIIQTIADHASRVTSLSFSPISRQLASGSWDGMLKIWEFER